MVKSYCVKERKQTECVPGTERYVKTKNNRTMMKCKCASCGITKAKFVKKSQSGGAVNTKPYCGRKKPPKGRIRGELKDCKNQVRYYGLKKVNQNLLEKMIDDQKIKKKVQKN